MTLERRYPMTQHIVLLVLITITLLVTLATSSSAHEIPAYADDAYPLAELQAVTQQLCHDDHAIVIQSLTSPVIGTYQLTSTRPGSSLCPGLAASLATS